MNVHAAMFLIRLKANAEKNIAVGTSFEDLPDDWVYPRCGAEKEYFEHLDD
jgi:rubredoxin